MQYLAWPPLIRITDHRPRINVGLTRQKIVNLCASGGWKCLCMSVCLFHKCSVLADSRIRGDLGHEYLAGIAHTNGKYRQRIAFGKLWPEVVRTSGTSGQG